MTLLYKDLAVKNGEDADADFYNRRFQLIVNAIADAVAMASLYGTTSEQLLGLGLSQVNGVLGPLLADISAASTLGFLIGVSGTSLIIAEGDSAAWTINEATRGLFKPTPFLTALDNGDSTKFAVLELVSYNETTGVMQANVSLVQGGASITAADWTIAASGGLPVALYNLSGDTATARDDAIAANTDAQAAKVECEALAAAFAGGGVASVAGHTGIVTLSTSDITGLISALAAKLAAASNLSDVANPVTARGNLGCGTAATHADTEYLHAASNLSDLASPSAARTSLALGNSATKNIGSTAGTVAAGDDPRITGTANFVYCAGLLF